MPAAPARLMARPPVAAAAPPLEVLVAEPEEDAPEEETPVEVVSAEDPVEAVSEEDPVELAPLVVSVPLVTVARGVEDTEELPEIVKASTVDMAAISLLYSEISAWISEVKYASAAEGRLVTQAG